MTDRSEAVESFSVRAAKPEDVRRILEIESSAFSDGWTEGTFLSCFNDSTDFFVLCREDRIIGFSVLDRALGDEAELHNIALCPEVRGKRLSNLLMDEMLRTARDKGVKKIMLEVRISNEAAIALYVKYGFEKVGLRPGYYRHPTESALLMDLRVCPQE